MSYNGEKDRKEVISPNGTKYYRAANGNLVQIYDLSPTPTRDATAQIKREEQALDPAARYSGLELDDE